MQESVGCVCATALNASDRRAETLFAQGAKREMHVIGHQHPGAFSRRLLARFGKTRLKPRVPVWQNTAEAAYTGLAKHG